MPEDERDGERAGLWRRLDGPRAVEALGATIASRLEPGDAVLLFGPLGAGKTTLARGLIRAMTGREEEAPSPTFTLMQLYETARFPLAHFDLYRLRSAAEAFETGLDEALDTGVAVVEWSERLGEEVPADRLEVHLALHLPGATPDGARWAKVAPFGDWRDRMRNGLDD